MRLAEIAWEDLQAMAAEEKASFFQHEGHAYHVLLAQQFGRPELDTLGTLATRIRQIAKSQPGMRFLRSRLDHKRAMLYFTQPSTRTFLSFCAACQTLGMPIGEVRDTATSSELKGETKEDSVRTFSSYFDCIVMRSQEGGLAERMAWVLSNSERPVPILNAGSGKDQHPTQALLDVYTLQRSFETRGGIDGKTVVFVGDLARGRTVRSLAVLLTNYADVRQVFVAPDPLQVGSDVLDLLRRRGVACACLSDLDEAIPQADAVYMTRVQDEWDREAGESAKIDTTQYWFTVDRLARLREDAVIMHPLPRRQEIPTDLDRDRRAVYWRQMRNGMWIRAALLASIFGADGSIHGYFEENC